MKVLIIPEDQSVDRHVIVPVVQRVFADLGRRAQIEVLPEPRLRGASHALSADLVREIVESRRMFDLFLLVVDRDCNREQHEEKAAARVAEHPDKLIACLAWQEVEVWLLALYRDELDDPWPIVRAECDPKERYCEPLLQRKGWSRLLGRGYAQAMGSLAGNWRGLVSVCPEIDELKQRIAAHLEAGTPA